MARPAQRPWPGTPEALWPRPPHRPYRIRQIQLSQLGPHRIPALNAHGRQDDLPGTGFHLKVFRGPTACVTLLGSVSWFLEVILASMAYGRK